VLGEPLDPDDGLLAGLSGLAEFADSGTDVPDAFEDGEAAARKTGATSVTVAAERKMFRIDFSFMRYQLVTRTGKAPFKISRARIR